MSLRNHEVCFSSICCNDATLHYWLLMRFKDTWMRGLHPRKHLPVLYNSTSRFYMCCVVPRYVLRGFILSYLRQEDHFTGVLAGRPGSSEVPRNPLTRWDVSSIPANGIFLTKKLKNKLKMPNRWRTIKSLVHKIRLHSRRGKGMAESFSR